MKQPTSVRTIALDTTIGMLLRYGVGVSAATVLLGGMLLFERQWHAGIDFYSFHGQPHYLTTVRTILAAALHGDARAIIQLGLLLLIATPVARVVFSVFAFWLQKDKLYVGISAFVLCMLVFGLLWH